MDIYNIHGGHSQQRPLCIPIDCFSLFQPMAALASDNYCGQDDAEALAEWQNMKEVPFQGKLC